MKQGTSHSNEFAVTNGLKQGCLLAATLFSFYRSAMLVIAFDDSLDGVSIQTRRKADLFIDAHFEARTKTSQRILG